MYLCLYKKLRGLQLNSICYLDDFLVAVVVLFNAK